VRRWGEQWERSKAAELPELDELARRLRAALPESGPPTIVHGDYRLDNTMLAPHDAGRIAAVLDWEMSTLGDPLADVGLFLLYWGQSEAQIIATGQAIDEQAGFASRDEIVEMYASATGRDVDNLDFYVVFAFYKLAIIVEGIAARYRMGKTLGEGFEHIGEMVKSLVNEALNQADQSSIPALRG
jgi:aminoglycoside phosphotransferase (APT) family kinase protein